MNGKAAWIISFESRYTRKIGGLGEVPPNIALRLPDKGYEAYIVTPGHGTGPSRGEPLLYLEKTGVETYLLPGPPPHIVFEGGALSDPNVYGPRVLDEKVWLLSRALQELVERLADTGLPKPVIIHGNDWHSVPPMLAAKKALAAQGTGPASVYHIHLLSRRHVDQGYLGKAGLDPWDEIPVMGRPRSIGELLEASAGSMDRLGAEASEALVTVSRRYLYTVLGVLGHRYSSRSGVVYNGTDWRITEIAEEASRLMGQRLDPREMKRWRRRLREKMLTEILEELGPGHVAVDDPEAAAFLAKVRGRGFREHGLPEGFPGDGPMVLMTGRLTRQKGFHVLLRGLEDLVAAVPDIRILLLVIPVWGSRRLIEEIVEAVELYPENLRAVFGRAATIYRPAHLAADAMAAPSIYEPFGIMAVEAMAAAAPVAASRTGGLAETVIDVREAGVMGTGLHHRPGYSSELASTLASLVLAMEAGYHEPYTAAWNRLVEAIPLEEVAQLLMENPGAPWLIRSSCIARAGEYTWEAAAEKTAGIYHEALGRAGRWVGEG